MTDDLIPSIEIPDVANRWRVITQKSLMAFDGDDENGLLSSLYNALDTVIKAAACIPRDAEGGADLQQALQEGIQAVVRLTLQLRRDISIQTRAGSAGQPSTSSPGSWLHVPPPSVLDERESCGLVQA